MTDRHPSMIAFLMLLVVFAAVMLFVLFTAVTKVRADVIRPAVDSHVVSVGASNVSYDASTGLLTVSDETGAFTYRRDGLSPTFLIYNLSGDFGGSYMLQALFDSTGADAPLDGLFKTAAGSIADLVIMGEIPGMSITVDDGYTGTLLRANVVRGEFFAFSSSNRTAEFNLLLEASGGDLVTAGEYYAGQPIGELSAVFTINPVLPAAFVFDNDFIATFQSGSLGMSIPEPATVLLTGIGLLGMLGARRLRKRPRRS